MKPFALVAPTASADGYGYSAEALALAAVRAHAADILFVSYDWTDQRYSDPALLNMLAQEYEIQTRDTLVVYFLPYGLGRFKSRVTINMTMWETDRLPDTWARLINQEANGVIVPSAHCKSVFEERVDVPVLSVPFGTDTQLFSYTERNRDEDEPFVFLMSGLLHYRKGAEFAIRAFKEEFAGGENVRLVLKTRLSFLDAGPQGIDDRWNRIQLIDADYTRNEMRCLYHAADCFLAPSRGEGSGLTPRDAMASGLPTILTAWGGLAELADERYTYPVDVECLEAAPEENSSYGQGVTGGGPIGNFARPSIAHLRERMRFAFENPSANRELGKRAAQWMRERWTWEHCAGEWLSAIEQLSKVPA